MFDGVMRATKQICITFLLAQRSNMQTVKLIQTVMRHNKSGDRNKTIPSDLDGNTARAHGAIARVGGDEGETGIGFVFDLLLLLLLLLLFRPGYLWFTENH